MKFDIKIKMTSDWHIGLGQSKGVIDSIVQRDKEGLPYIPAKTLTGILRDSCETVALGLDDGDENGIWNHCLNFLFGSQPALDDSKIETPPIPAILSLRPAYLPQQLREVLNSKEKVIESIAFIKAGISIDNDTGCAKKDFLRFEEMIRMGANLIATDCQIKFPQGIKDNEKQMAYALLLAGVQITERIGGKRRRGAGKCQISIDENNTYIDFLAQQVSLFSGEKEKGEGKMIESLRQSFSYSNEDESKEKDKKDNSNSKTKAVEIVNDSAWHTLPIKITTITPVIIPSRTIGNVVETLDYIPAKYLLRSLNNLLGEYINVFEEINRGNLVITNGTIMIDNQPSRPTPFCLEKDKVKGDLDKGFVCNRFVETQEEVTKHGFNQLKAIRGDYLGKIKNKQNQSKETEDCLPKSATVDINVYTHNTVKDELQRPSSDIGGVYSYNAIVPDTILLAEIRLKSDLLEFIKQKNNNNDNWWKSIDDEYVIGQSKKDDYGKVRIKAKPYEEKSNYQEDEIEIRNNLLYVWLLSDVLLRDKRLRPTADLNVFKKTLEDAINKDASQDNVSKVELIERKIDEKEDLLSLSVRQRRTESWQVRWRLPRPSLIGIQAGSCMVYQVKSKNNNQTLDIEKLKQKLKQIQITGIGERKAEGYGQLCFNDSLLTQKLSQLKPYPKDNKSDDDSNKSNRNSKKGNKNITPIDDDYARLIEKQAWREAIQQKALALASDKDTRNKILGVTVDENKDSIPPMTQLGRLRSIISTLQIEDTKKTNGKIIVKNKDKIINWLDSIQEKEKKNPNSQKWGKERLKTIRTLVNDKRKIWQYLSSAEDINRIEFDKLTITKNGDRKLKEELWAEAIRTLVNAIIRGHKRDWEKEASQAEENKDND